MRKNILALGIAAAISSMGMVSGAFAMQAAPTGGAATSLAVNPNGIGHMLVVPYFTAQGANATLLSVTNTANVGKVVKVRFRGAANSDDVFDFTLILSANDMWTGAVSKDAVSGKAKIDTVDNSCTLPTIKGVAANQAFLTTRVDTALSTAEKANQTLEGYIELITMADIVAGHPLSTAITHTAGTSPNNTPVNCAAPAVTALVANPADNAAANALGLTLPTTGIAANYVIINQTSTTSWSGAATAIEARLGAAPSTGNIVFWPQVNNTTQVPAVTLTGPTVAFATADPWLNQVPAQALYLDFPDLSTPYTAGAISATPTAQAVDISTSLQNARLVNEYVVDTSILAETDWLLSFPTRRYAVAVNYAAGTIAQNAGNTTFWNSGVNAALSTTENGTKGRRICLTGLAGPGLNTIFNREEATPGAGAGSPFVVSPAEPVAGSGNTPICGEASVISWNAVGRNSALLSVIGRTDMSAAFMNTNPSGWINFATPGATAAGLPYIGSAFIRAANGTINYGFGYPHKK